MKIKTTELIGPALDWSVAKCEGAHGIRLHHWNSLDPVPPSWVIDWERDWTTLVDYSPSTDWSLGGPLIERECITVQHAWDYSQKVNQCFWWAMTDHRMLHRYGPTPLIAAMRTLVAFKLGDVVEVPDELIEGTTS